MRGRVAVVTRLPCPCCTHTHITNTWKIHKIHTDTHTHTHIHTVPRKSQFNFTMYIDLLAWLPAPSLLTFTHHALSRLDGRYADVYILWEWGWEEKNIFPQILEPSSSSSSFPLVLLEVWVGSELNWITFWGRKKKTGKE